jgi:hypothetical protein
VANIKYFICVAFLLLYSEIQSKIEFSSNVSTINYQNKKRTKSLVESDLFEAKEKLNPLNWWGESKSRAVPKKTLLEERVEDLEEKALSLFTEKNPLAPAIGQNIFEDIEGVDESYIPRTTVDANSWAIVALEERIKLLDDSVSENKIAVESLNSKIFNGKINGLGSAISGCHVSHGGKTHSMKWSPDGKYLALGGTEVVGVSVRIWELIDENQFVALPGCNFAHGSLVKSVSWHPSGNFLAIVGGNGDGKFNARILEFKDQALVELPKCRLDSKRNINGIAWSHSGEFILGCGTTIAGGDEARVYRFLENEREIAFIPGCGFNHGGVLYGLDWSVDDSCVAVCGNGGTGGYTIRAFDFSGTDSTFSLKSGCNKNFDSLVEEIKWHPDGNSVFACSRQDHVQGYSFDGTSFTKKPDMYAASKGNVNELTFSADGEFLFAGTDDGSNGYNLIGFHFDGVKLTEELAANVLQGIGDGDAIALRGDDSMITVAGDDSIKIDSYPLKKESLVHSNSNAIVKISSKINSYDDLIFANSSSVVSIDSRLDQVELLANLNKLVADKVDGMPEKITANSSAIVFIKNYIDEINKLAVSNSNVLVAHSGSIASLDELSRANSASSFYVWNEIFDGSNSLVSGNSNALVENREKLIDQKKIIVSNSWAILTLDERIYETLVLDNSWSVKAISERVLEIDSKILDNSNAISAHSWSIANLDEREKTDSSAIVSHSWSLINLNERELADSCAIVANSFSAASLSEKEHANSNAIVAANEIIIAQSWSISNLTEREIANSSAVFVQNSGIAIYAEVSEYFGSIDHGPANIHFLDPLMTLSYDLFLSEDHKLYAKNSMNIDGAGHTIKFPINTIDESIVVADGANVVFNDVVLENIGVKNVSLGLDSAISFSGTSMILLGGNEDLSGMLGFSGKTKIDGKHYSAKIMPGGSVQILPGAELTLENLTISGLTNGSIVFHDSESRLILKNTELMCTNEFTFTTGAFVVENFACFRGGGTFSYLSDQSSKIEKYSKLLIENGTTFDYKTTSLNPYCFVFEDYTSKLHLDRATIKIGESCLNLTKGTLELSQQNFMQCNGESCHLNLGNGSVAENLCINIHPGGSIKLLSGTLNYKNEEN